MAELIFLGTGGGRVNLIRQLRSTGGFVARSGKLTIYIDPGPGALINSSKAFLDPLKADCVIVTHSHIDHVHDAPLIIEAMTNFMLKKKGILIASKSVLQGDEFGDKTICTYHQSMLEKAIVFSSNSKEEIKAKNSSFRITGTPVKHDDKAGFGFVLEIGGKKIGYTSDTELLPTHKENFAGCDVLVANNIKPDTDPYPGHLFSSQTAKLFAMAKPKAGIITHFGMKIITSGPDLEAAKIQKASGVRTFAARDLHSYDIEKMIWRKPSKNSKDGQKKLFDT